MKNSKLKNILAATAIILAGVLTLGLAIDLCYNAGLLGSEEVISSNTEEASGGTLVSSGESNGIQLLSATGNYVTTSNGTSLEYVEDSITLTAIYNSDAMSPKFTWTCTNSTNITITPSSDTKSCVVTCNSAFGTQATITCTADDNENAYATCTVDYIKRATNAALTITNSGGDNLVWSSNSSTATWTLPEWTSATYGQATQSVSYYLELGSYTPTLGTGTVSETYTLTSLGYSTSTTTGSGTTVRSYDIADSYAYYNTVLYAYCGVESTSTTNVQTIYTYLTATPTRTITLTFVGDTTGIEYSYTYSINVDASNLYTSVSSVSLDYTAVSF